MSVTLALLLGSRWAGELLESKKITSLRYTVLIKKKTLFLIRWATKLTPKLSFELAQPHIHMNIHSVFVCVSLPVSVSYIHTCVCEYVGGGHPMEGFNFNFI